MRANPFFQPLQPQPHLTGSRYAPRGVAVLIPAYQPTVELEDLVARLSAADTPAILLVDDGSSPDRQPVFDRLAQRPCVHLIHHSENHGKGAALKTGIRYFIEHLRHYKGLVTADSDGQHAPDDVIRLARALHNNSGLAILGTRTFARRPNANKAPGTNVPLRSRFGNYASASLFRTITGVTITDVQTGLRALPTSLLTSLVELPGERYEFEMAVLVHIARTLHPLAEYPIRTLYQANNVSSHFRPLVDSCRVLRVLLAQPRLAAAGISAPEELAPNPSPSEHRRPLRTK